MKKILFTGGGSAGHVTPNVALIEEILKTGEADLCYMGSNGIEKELISRYKIPYFTIDPPKLIRSFRLSNFKIPFAFQRAVRKAEEGVRAFAPDVVFSKGGYVALPVVFAAAKQKIPCFTHESDLSLGLANKLMASRCEKVLTSFPETADKIKKGKYVGSPLRSSLFAYSRKEAREYYRLPEKTKRKTLLVFGGGSGSKTLNAALREHLPVLSKRYDILHLCGKGNAIFTRYNGYIEKEYEEDMGRAYAACDFVLARAGSNTIFEILAFKKPSLLVPLGGQTRGDQAENAAYFQKKGFVGVLSEDKLSTLPQAIEEVLSDTAVQERLALSDYANGKENILNELRKFL